MLCFREDWELDLEPPNGLVDRDRRPRLELYDEVIEGVLEEFNLPIKKLSGAAGFEPTLNARKGFPEHKNEGGLFTVGEVGILSRSSALPIFSNIARAL